jgi:hypothetical protein
MSTHEQPDHRTSFSPRRDRQPDRRPAKHPDREPPGSMIEGVTPDENGMTWWEGDRPEWRLYQ